MKVEHTAIARREDFKRPADIEGTAITRDRIEQTTAGNRENTARRSKVTFECRYCHKAFRNKQYYQSHLEAHLYELRRQKEEKKRYERS